MLSHWLSGTEAAIMGSSSSKEAKATSKPNNLENINRHNAAGQSSPAQTSSQDRQAAYASAQRYIRAGRADLSLLGLVRERDNTQSSSDRPRETKPEREARKAERERSMRLKERERSLREEHVDGGYLVTLGTYTGPEDFNKSIVRQLQVGHSTLSRCEWR